MTTLITTVITTNIIKIGSRSNRGENFPVCEILSFGSFDTFVGQIFTQFYKRSPFFAS